MHKFSDTNGIYFSLDPHFKGGVTQGKGNTSKPANDQHNKNKKKEINDNNEMARVLKSNPNISMRELFPGEDEMALQINLPFHSNNAQRTPEGWAKVQMTIQYDDVTKALWEHLQRPYGNQSSFIRHLVLLEKYYRNGDLVLSQSASNSAVTYSQSVRNRLRSYDNIPSSLSNTSAANLSNEITIIPTTKARNKSNDSLTITPQPGNSLLKRKSSQNTESSCSPKQKIAKVNDETTQPKKSSPPELISFSQKPSTRSAACAKEKEPTASTSQSISSTPTATTTTTSSSSSTSSQTGSSNGNTNSNSTNNNNVIVLPDSLTQQERKQCTKSWRPTLIPITGSGQLLNSNGPLYQTADGRKLPELVQVMSGGKPYHISIHDYNKMCIIRREKLQQQLTQKARQQHNQNISQALTSATSTITTSTTTSATNLIPASTNSLSIIPMPKEKEGFKPSTTSTPSNIANKLANIPNQILEQNSFIPLNSNSEQNGKKYQNGGAGLPPPLTHTNYSKNTSALVSMLPPALSALSKTVNALQPTSSAAAQLAAWNSLWNDNEININSDNMAALTQIANLANLGTVGMMDASAASLLSKIPKSLTVIPQAKNDRRSSDEQKNSAST